MADCGEAIPLSDRASWQRALERLPHAVGHTWASCQAMQQTTGHPTFLYRYRSATAECACPISVRNFDRHEDVYTPYGFSGFTGHGDGEEMADAWRRFAGDRGYVAGYIVLNPLLAPPAFALLDECRTTDDLFFLDLRREPQVLRRNMDRNRQRQIATWERDGRPLICDRAQLEDFFCRNFAQFMRSRGASGTYAFSAETVRLLATARSNILLGAGTSTAIEAAALFARSPTIGEYLFLVAAPGGERHAAALVWAGALALRELGVNWLSLGGGVKGRDGVAEFKRRFGAERQPLRVLEQVYDHATFDLLCEGAEDVEGGLPEYFPPYYRRSLDVR